MAANREMSEKGLRVLAFAVRDLTGRRRPRSPPTRCRSSASCSSSGMVGIIDPLRPSAVEAVRIARQAGIEVRMITGDHADHRLGDRRRARPGPRGDQRAEIAAMSDEDLTAALRDLHVFGRVTPQDKLRLAKLMQPAATSWP